MRFPNITKGTTDPRVLVTKVTSLGHITSSQTNLYKISSSYSRPSSNLKKSTKYQHQLNFKILTKLSFRISTKNNLHNLNQGSAAKYWLKISPELQLQNLDQTLCSKSGILDRNLILWPNLSFQICNSNNLNKFWVGTPGSHQSSLLSSS